jgi:hypothetical protein
MNILTWLITILGFIATIIGSILALATYVSPLFRLKIYIKKNKNWKKFYMGRVEYNWQYKNHPEFVIEISHEDKKWSAIESWMRHYPDPLKNISIVKARVNGNILLTEVFISLDGGRYFVPVPKRKLISENEFKYWYTPMQVRLSRIVGYYYNAKTVEEFMSEHGLVIEKIEE